MALRKIIVLGIAAVSFGAFAPIAKDAAAMVVKQENNGVQVYRNLAVRQGLPVRPVFRQSTRPPGEIIQPNVRTVEPQPANCDARVRRVRETGQGADILCR